VADPFANYDAWLERPYQDMMDETENFFDWCEDNDIDPDDPEAEVLYLNACNEDYEEYDEEEYEADYEEEGW
jgi:hypothetical protein